MHTAILLALSLLFSTATMPALASNSQLDFYARPHQLVSLPDGRKINLVCMGSGSPTVLLLIGLRGWSEDWYKVQEPISHKTRVCSWDRPGFGFSDPSPLEQDITNTTKDFVATLNNAKIKGPFILVAHSMGALEAMTYADTHMDQVTGIVFVDPSSPGGMERMKNITPKFYVENNKSNASSVRELKECARELQAGTFNAENCSTFKPINSARLKKVHDKTDNNPLRFLTRISLEDKLEKSFELAVNPKRNYGHIPIRVLSAGDMPTFPPPFDPEAAKQFPAFFDDWHAEQKKLSQLSSDGKFTVVNGSGHNMQDDKPEAVINAVNEVIHAVRSHRH